MKTPAILKPLQGLLDRGLENSSQARAIARQLEGRTLAVQLSPEAEHGGHAVFLSVADGKISVYSDFDSEPDVIVATGLTGLIDLASSGTAEAVRKGRVAFLGDAEIAEGFQQLLQLTRPDWEEELSRLTGDAAAHQIGNVIRTGFEFGRKILNTAGRNAAEFLQEESRDLPSQPEMGKWFADVDKLREDVDRLETKVSRMDGADG